VSIDSLEKPYWQKHYVVAKRVLPKDQQALALASAKPSIAGLAPRFRSNRQQR
jgi:hypothetical protein